MQSTRIGKVIETNRESLEKTGIRNLSDLRRKMAGGRPEPLELSGDALKVVGSFASAARIFPQEIAAVLTEHDGLDASTLANWTEDQFGEALAAGRISENEINKQRKRFARFRELAKTHAQPDRITGLQLDLGKQYSLLKKHAADLAANGIETLADWANLRDKIKVGKKAQDLLDVHARFSVFDFDPDTVERLSDEGIDSATALSRLSDADIGRIAKARDIDSVTLTAARQLAVQWAGTLLQILPGVPSLPDFVLPPGICLACADQGVFSKFGYYLYLLDRTGQSAEFMQTYFFQEFPGLTPEDENETVSQVSICNQVLRAALGRPLTQIENLPYVTFNVLSALRNVVPRSVSQVVSFLTQATNTAPSPDLVSRLTEAYAAPPPATEYEMLHPQPVFTRDEIDLLGAVGEAILSEEIRASPGFADATPQEISDEIRRRISLRPDAGVERLIFRAELKKALNLNDRQLFNRYCIETDLPLCEQTTKLDQAIRTLQTYLELTRSDSPRYLSYATWRGEALGTAYPEATILLQDDVLVSASGSSDRGSILQNHKVQYAELKSQLATIREAIDEARVSLSNNENMSRSQWNELSRFSTEPTYANFQQGLTVIEDILQANDLLYRAGSDLDREEPGIALANLQDALVILDRVDYALFAGDGSWSNLQPSAARYSDLLRLDPRTRKERLRFRFFDLAQLTKKVFQLQSNNPQVSGLTDLRTLQVGNSEWRASPEFEQGDQYIVRKEASSSRHSDFRFDGEADLADYTFGCEFRIRSYWDWRNVDRWPKIGIGFRQQDGSSAGYRLAILPGGSYSGDRWVSTETLALQMLDTLGRVTDFAEGEIGTENRTDVEGGTVRLDHWYRLTVTASGGQLSGSLRKSPDRTISIGPVQDPTFDTGAISVFVEGSAEVEFRYFTFSAEAPTGAPPFFARRRHRIEFQRRSELDEADYWNHRELAWPMTSELLGEPLAIPTDIYRKTRLWGVKRDNSNLYLTFQPGSSLVVLDRLDWLLERAIMLTYYLRFVAIPSRMAQAYVAMGEYETAADLLHLLYDDDATVPEERSMYSFFDQSWPTGLVELGTDASAMRIRLGEVYSRWAETLFRQNSESSRFQARRLYERILRLHSREDCDCVMNQARGAQQVLALGRQAGDSQAMAMARKLLRRDSVISADKIAKAGSWTDAWKLIQSEEVKHAATVKSEGTSEKIRSRAVERLKAAELKLVGTEAANGGPPIPKRFPRSAPVHSSLTLRSSWYLCTPENPLVGAQSREACLMLEMLRNCVNILGYSDSLVPPLRFETLLRIAQNFANLAQAAERDVLQFRQAFEQETFALMEAQSTLDQANVEVAIERLNVELAEGEIALSNLQQEQAQAGVAHFETLVSEGMTTTERSALAAAEAAAGLASISAIFNIATSPVQFVTSAAAGNPAGGAVSAFGQNLGGLQNAFSARSTALTIRASLERQQQDREFQLQQMRFGLAIASQGAALAEQRWTIAQMQEEMAELRQDFARDAVAFLNNKALSAAAWLMLMKVAREQYRRRLSYAIETAYLAERALAFELQSSTLKIIRFDYYDLRKDGLLGATQLLTDLAQLEHRRLAFRRRKLQLSKTVSLATLFPATFQAFRGGRGAIAFGAPPELFDRDFPGHFMRLIQSVRVTVVALVPPYEGIHATLRNSGFSQVVVGPPYADQFATRTISRKPECVSLSAPFQASGLFVLDYEDELLLPFEGSGVVTDWAFELPKAANQFDFNTIADVLLTVEYTALEGTADYREEVRQRLGRNIHAERAYSFRADFPDQWYDLHHPELVTDDQQPMVVRFKTLRQDFPPNLSQIRMEHVALFFAHEGSSFSPVPISYLNFHDDGNRDSVDSNGDGVISTRLSDGAGAVPASWRTIMINQRPVGTWELSFNFGQALADEAIRQRFREGNIRDILLVITYRGRTSQW